MLENLGVDLGRIGAGVDVDFLNHFAVLLHYTPAGNEGVLYNLVRWIVRYSEFQRSRAVRELELILHMKDPIGPRAQPVSRLLAVRHRKIDDMSVYSNDVFRSDQFDLRAIFLIPQEI